MNEELRTRLKGHYFEQFGHEMLVTKMPFKYLQSIFEVDPYVQRELDPRRRNVIKEFILNTVQTSTFHFSPFVYSARGNLERDGDFWAVKPGEKLAIIDGQHRSAGLKSALTNLYIKREAFEESPMNRHHEIDNINLAIEKLEKYPITMQIYLNLTTQEERQLFTDLNTERKNAHRGLIMKYEQRDEYVLLVRAIAGKLAHHLDIEPALTRLTVNNTSITSFVMMRRCLVALFEGILTYKEGEPKLKYCQREEVEPIAFKFFKTWCDIFPNGAGDRNRYVCGLSGIQVALAYTVFQLVSNQRCSYFQAIDELKKLKNKTSWKHKDLQFCEFYDPKQKRIRNHASQQSILKLTNLFINNIAYGELNSIGR
ncbi:DNA sulfur modification protein DndB [Metabacillus arenae]|uniref:DGQHR domain-containing protein n=1 Tax=Metabacillus arenae TaxID=2771434 RepID=A0A926RZH2_9BACI|nr:DNA sulfur modification protein DndB [Metabacillus arenae]MBD1383116.1 hypothetical protein [Metabacillus arenae]